MLSERIRIVDTGVGSVRVQALPSGQCAQCACRPGCGRNWLSPRRRDRAVRLDKRVIAVRPDSLAPDSLKKGSTVHIQIPEFKLLYLSSVFYLVPLGGMLAVTTAASMLNLDEAVTVAAAMLALFGVFPLLHRYFGAGGRAGKDTIVLTAVNSEDEVFYNDE